MLKFILYTTILIVINVIVIYSNDSITYEYYVFANIFVFAAYIQYTKIVFLRYIFKDKSISANQYYKYLQKIVFLLLYFTSASFTLLEGQYLLFSLSTIASIVSAFSIKYNWTEMQKDKQAMNHVSAK